MAVGNLVDVAPQGDGAYSFKTNDGREMLFSRNPETDALAQAVQRAKAAQPLTAQNMTPAGPGASVSDVPAEVPGASGGTNYAAYFTQPEQSQGFGGAAPAAPAAPAPAEQGPIPVADVFDAAAQQELMRGPRRTAGVSREQLQQKAAGAVATPSGLTTTQEGGMPDDMLQSLRESRADASINEQLARQDIAARQAAQQAAMVQQADQQMAGAAQRIADRSAILDSAKKKHEEGWQKYQQLRQDYASRKVDPNRLYSGAGGAVAAIGSIIGQALGAYGATLGHTPNFAMQIVESAINRDIAAQEAEIKVLGDSADNALRDWQLKTGGDLEDAKAMLKGAQMDYAQTEAMRMAAATKRQDIIDAYSLWSAEHQNKRAQEDEELRIKALGKHVRSETARYEFERAGGVESTDAFLNRVGKLTSTATGIRQGQANVAATQGKAAKEASEAAKNAREAQGGSPQEKAEYNKNMQLVDTGIGVLKDIAASGNMELDEKTGRVTQKGDIPGVGIIDNNLIGTLSTAGTEFQQKLRLTVPILEKGLEGDAASEAAIKEIKEGLDLNNETKMVSGLNALSMAYRARGAAVKAGATRTARQGREQERQSANIENAQQDTLPSPERL